jgi:hypothetical protein
VVLEDICIIPDSRRFPDLVSFAWDFWSGGMDLFLREASDRIGDDDVLSKVDAARIGGRSGRS